MPDGGFRTRLQESTVIGVAEAIMKPLVIVAEVFADVVRCAMMAIAHIPSLIRALVPPMLWVLFVASLLGTGGAAGYAFGTYQALKPAPHLQLTPGHTDAPQSVPEPPGDASPPFGPRIPALSSDPFGLH